MTSPAVPMSRIPPYLQTVETELRLVEDALSDVLKSDVSMATLVSRYILEAGGKRLRPALVILSAKASGSVQYDAASVGAAASMELVHMATLMHDDVIDGAATRRGRMTANRQWGNQISVLTGDYMLAKSFVLLAKCNDFRVMHVLAEATTAMSEGEIRQIESNRDPKAPIATYLSVIHGKTAAFMSACCRVGAIIAGASTDAESALARYGASIGMAFQVTDDLLDLIGDPAQTGKPIGNDIREGKVTMPMILTRERAGIADRSALDEIIMRDGQITGDEVGFIRDLAESTGALDATRDAAQDYIRRSVESLHSLPCSDARDALEDLAGGILHRDR